MFVTNKWDTIEHNAEGSDENSSDEDDVTKTWNTLKANIKKHWSSVKEENIYRMSLKDVSMNMLLKIILSRIRCTTLNTKKLLQFKNYIVYLSFLV